MDILAVNETESTKESSLVESRVIQGFDYQDETLGTMLTSTESSNIMKSMMQSIDLHELASAYFALLTSKLPCSAIKINFANQTLAFGTEERSGRSLKISLDYGQPFGAPQHAQLAYVFDKVLTPVQRKLLSEVHAIYAMGLKHALEYYRIRQLATKDMLTGLYNRSHFNDSLQKLMSISLRNKQSFGLLVLDLDNFKQVNDKFGHQCGDQVLIEFANVLQSCLRESDHAFRFGGDEFCCLLVDSDKRANESVAKRIQQALADTPLFQKHDVSSSVGATTFRAEDSEKSLFHRADLALLSAKQNGKNLFKAA
ncbi:GGDEF domain-containing protein [Glaciecola sp. MH2013]|uniref:GGDEF domain-containing protein n=1 Tax=Glaciecola sp. MH2013 TaxID=2785524 RepID=UPI00189E7569|nr:GGDEF domain-containing protein [Glaciecola sp. MH2013]MBF7072286.1 GGDEF domain-containing protein [Glaciecola sp. MH2013]